MFQKCVANLHVRLNKEFSTINCSSRYPKKIVALFSIYVLQFIAFLYFIKFYFISTNENKTKRRKQVNVLYVLYENINYTFFNNMVKDVHHYAYLITFLQILCKHTKYIQM